MDLNFHERPSKNVNCPYGCGEASPTYRGGQEEPPDFGIRTWGWFWIFPCGHIHAPRLTREDS